MTNGGGGGGYYELVLVKYEYGVQHCLFKRSLIDLSTKSIVKLKSCKGMSPHPLSFQKKCFPQLMSKCVLAGENSEKIW